MNPYFFTKQFGDDEETEDAGTSSGSDATYAFEGFTIELNEKIMLTPVTENQPVKN